MTNISDKKDHAKEEEKLEQVYTNPLINNN